MDAVNPLAPQWIPFLASTPIFGELSEAALRDLARELEPVNFEAGETLIRQGDRGDCMYLIVEGRVLVMGVGEGGEEKVLAGLGPGQQVGELALWTGEPRSATVCAVAPVRAARLTREGFDRFAGSHPEAVQAVDRFVGQRLRRNRLSAAVRLSKLFCDLDEDALRDLEAELEPLWIEGGKTLFRQGDAGDSLYLVVNGKLRVVAETAGEAPRILGEIGAAETAGEMALLDGEPRSATVVAARDSELARLSKAGFERLISARQALLALIIKKLVARLRRLDAAASTQVYSRHSQGAAVAVATLSAGVPLSDFCALLAKGFSELGPALCIDSEWIDGYLGKKGAAQTGESETGHGRIVDLLAKLEAEYRFVIYQADAADSTWTRRCIRQCDHLLLVASPETAAGASGNETDMPRALDRGAAGLDTSLALLHRDSTRQPTGTAEWIARSHVRQHYHIRMNRQADFDRVARCLSGNAVGLVLGGGAARGIAHAGVVRALREACVPIDIVGGASMGAIMGAVCALDYEYKRMLAANLKGWAAIVKDKTIPIVSFLSGHKLAQALLDETGGIQIEDLWIPFFCVSANLTRAHIKVHTEGPLVKSLLASARVPGLYPPIVWDGDLLVDGGIVNNIPVDIMRGYPACGRVIASDVSPAYDLPGASDYGTGVSGWRALLEWLRPGTPGRFPSVFSVLMRTVEFGRAASEAQNAGAADLYLAPPMGSFKAADYKRGEEMAEAAYHYSTAKIAEWLASGAARISASLRV